MLNRFYKIVDFSDSYFKKIEFDKNIDISSDIIRLNYENFSPLLDGEMSFYKGNNYIYLWYYKNQKSKKILIPYSYIIFSYLKQNYQNHILSIKYKNEFVILVIKNSLLADTFISKKEDTNSVFSLQEQYPSLEYKVFSDKESQEILNKTLKINISVFIKFLLNDIDLIKIVKNFLFSLIIPFSIVLYFYMGLNFLNTYLLKTEYKTLEKEYKQSKSKNNDFRSDFYYNYETFMKLSSFERDELIYNNQFLVLSKITNIIKENNSTLQRIYFTGNNIDFVVKDVNNSVDLLNKLISVNDFSKVVIYNNNEKISQTAFKATLKILGE